MLTVLYTRSRMYFPIYIYIFHMFLTIFGMQEFHEDFETFFFSIIQKASFPAETGKNGAGAKSD